MGSLGKRTNETSIVGMVFQQNIITRYVRLEAEGVWKSPP